MVDDLSDVWEVLFVLNQFARLTDVEECEVGAMKQACRGTVGANSLVGFLLSCEGVSETDPRRSESPVQLRRLWRKEMKRTKMRRCIKKKTLTKKTKKRQNK